MRRRLFERCCSDRISKASASSAARLSTAVVARGCASGVERLARAARGNVGRQHQRVAANLPNFFRGDSEGIHVPGHQPHLRAPCPEGAGHRAVTPLVVPVTTITCSGVGGIVGPSSLRAITCYPFDWSGAVRPGHQARALQALGRRHHSVAGRLLHLLHQPLEVGVQQSRQSVGSRPSTRTNVRRPTCGIDALLQTLNATIQNTRRHSSSLWRRHLAVARQVLQSPHAGEIPSLSGHTERMCVEGDLTSWQ